MVAVLVVLHVVITSCFHVPNNMLGRKAADVLRTSTELYSLNAKWISVALEEESKSQPVRASSPSPKPPSDNGDDEKKSETKAPVISTATPSPDSEPAKLTPVDPVEVSQKPTEVSVKEASVTEPIKAAEVESKSSPIPAPMPLTEVADDRPVEKAAKPVDGPAKAQFEATPKQVRNSAVSKPAPEEKKVSVAASVPDWEPSVATRVTSAVVNTPPEDPDGVILKDVKVGLVQEDTEEKQQREQKELLRAQQAIAKSFLKLGKDAVLAEGNIAQPKDEKSGGLFDIFKKQDSSAALPERSAESFQKPIAVPESKPVQDIPMPAKIEGLLGFLAPSPGFRPQDRDFAPTSAPRKVVVREEKLEVSPVQSSPVVKEDKKPETKKSGGNLFGFLAPNESKLDQPKVVAKPVAASVPVTRAAPTTKSSKPVAMNSKFLQTISKLSKGDSSKIKSFQKSTDEYRAGSLTADNFLKQIEVLFGVENVDEVIKPLCDELPELERSKTLLATYKNLQSKKASSSNSGFFSMFSKTDKPVPLAKTAPAPQKSVPIAAKAAPKPAPKPPVQMASKPIPRPVVASETKKFVTPTKPLSPPPAAIQRQVPVPPKPSPVASKIAPKPSVTIGRVKVPGVIPATSQVIYVQRFNSLLGGSLDPASFYKFLSTEVGLDIAQAALPEIIRELPGDKGKKLSEAARK